MIAYVDASVLLRRAFEQRGALALGPGVEALYSSALLATECLRTVDRLRLRGALTDSAVANVRAAVYQQLGRVNLIALESDVLDRAAQPMPTALGTLDAIHLASALLWRAQDRLDAFLTHDEELGRAARAHGLQVIGCSGP